MRETKFRGKVVRSNRWAYGGFFKTPDGKCFIVFDDVEICGGAMLNDVITDFLEVEPKSVGQYTGRKDNTGRDIYEGHTINGQCDFGPGGFSERMAIVEFDINLGYQWQYWDMDTIQIIGTKKE